MTLLKLALIILLTLALPSSVLPTFAQEGSNAGEECFVVSSGLLQCGDEPPLINSDDNACFPGGAMYRAGEVGNGCPDMDHWVCGWYLARYHIENPTWAETYMPPHCLPFVARVPVCFFIGGIQICQ